MKKEEEPKQKNKKKLIGLIVLICGILACIAGLVFLLVDLLTGPGLRDAEYLVEVGEWVREDEPSVIWQFTEIGKGTLTTNSHTNDYDFIWAISDDVLEIETSWLYTLNDNFEYVLDQDANTLVLTSGDRIITFLANAQTP
ncbi:hypothetical protein IKT18_02950 [Candidatus Saccharibacteria bacterium]|nr:hypothetical protein [Candidatus Saccharibacteria bacterium]